MIGASANTDLKVYSGFFSELKRANIYIYIARLSYIYIYTWISDL